MVPASSNRQGHNIRLHRWPWLVKACILKLFLINHSTLLISVVVFWLLLNYGVLEQQDCANILRQQKEPRALSSAFLLFLVMPFQAWRFSSILNFTRAHFSAGPGLTKCAHLSPLTRISCMTPGRSGVFQFPAPGRSCREGGKDAVKKMSVKHWMQNSSSFNSSESSWGIYGTLPTWLCHMPSQARNWDCQNIASMLVNLHQGSNCHQTSSVKLPEPSLIKKPRES